MFLAFATDSMEVINNSELVIINNLLNGLILHDEPEHYYGKEMHDKSAVMQLLLP